MLTRKVEALKISWLLLLLVLTVIACAIAIYCLSPGKNGVVPTTDAPAAISFMDALYFSVVTISSLGYGDYRPIGYGRLIAAMEVVVGLVLIALIVSKLASDRTAIYVRLLYTSDSERRLKDFKTDLQSRFDSMRVAHRDHNHQAKIKEILSLGLITVNLAKYYEYQVRVGALGEDWARKNSLHIVKIIVLSAQELGLIGKAALTSREERQHIETTFRHMVRAVDAISDTHTTQDFTSAKQHLARTIQSFHRYIAEGRAKPTFSELTPYILTQVKQVLPSKPWPKNMHKEVAKKLRISNKLAHKAISALELSSADYRAYVS